MSDFAKLQPGIFEGAMQALLDAKRKVTAAEDAISGVIPLAENPDTAAKLEEIREALAKAAYAMQSIYNRNAKEAFKA
jgi:hypothetical protein